MTLSDELAGLAHELGGTWRQTRKRDWTEAEWRDFEAWNERELRRLYESGAPITVVLADSEDDGPPHSPTVTLRLDV